MYRLAILLLLCAAPLQAHDLTARCHASSSWDVTLEAPTGLVFDRTGPAPTRVDWNAGVLRVDGAAVALGAEGEDRMALFERELRALAPRVRQVARHSLDLAAATLREEVGTLTLDPATWSAFDTRLGQHVDALRRQIDASRSTHDWQGDAVTSTLQRMAGDLLPLVAGALGQQALDAAMRGDLAGAQRLQGEAADLASRLRPAVEARLTTLQPEVDALCPAVRRLAALQDGVRDGAGRALDLLDVEP